MNRFQSFQSVRFLQVCAVFLAGCTVGPDFSPPSFETSGKWRELDDVQQTPGIPESWWILLQDPVLDLLEKQALEANADVELAAARIDEARALLTESRSARLPEFFAVSEYSRSRAKSSSGGSVTSDWFEFRNLLNYEIDLWGRVRRSNEAADAEYSATIDDLATVQLLVACEVARAYVSIRSTDDEARLIDATIELRRDALRLQLDRLDSGLVNEADVASARTELATVEAEGEAVARERARLEHALAVLCGREPGGFLLEHATTSFAVPSIPAGLPSTLLERRSDVAGAIHRVEAANARIGVATAELFPTFSLTGSFGVAGAELGDLANGSSRFWTVSPNAFVPIFDGGRRSSRVDMAVVGRERALTEFRATALAAFREVEDALSDLQTLSAQHSAMNEASISAQTTFDLADERYRQGLSSYLEVVDAQRMALQAERQIVRLKGARVIASINLIKALGGGWIPDEPDSTAGESNFGSSLAIAAK